MKAQSSPPYFLVASHLASLARQLRFAGLDCRILSSEEEKALNGLSLESGQYYLTRRRAPLPSSSLERQTLHLQSSRLDEQMLEVAHTFQLKNFFKPFSRCMLCNSPLQKLSKDEVRGEVPTLILENRSDFRQCPDCERIYWTGDHYRKMRERWEEIFAKVPEGKE